MTARLSPLDLAVVAAYIAGMTLMGAWFTRRQKDLRTYFVGGRNVGWFMVLISIVATETSAVTFLSVPGLAYNPDGGNMTFLQLAMGYIVGRCLVSWLLLPLYMRGELFSAYEVLRQKFGPSVQRVASGLFLITRTIADGLRLFLTALVVQYVGVGVEAAIVGVGVVTIVYTYLGGMKAVLWTDLVQFLIKIGGAGLAFGFILYNLPGGWDEFTAVGNATNKFQVFDFGWDPTVALNVWAGVIGGAVFSMASHGADQLMVQRYLCARSLGQARLALVLSGFTVFAQFILFLFVGIGLYAARQNGYFLPGTATKDEVFGLFIVTRLPVGVVGILVAAILAAAMSTLSSSLNSSANAFVTDFYRPLRPQHSEQFYVLLSRIMTVVWGIAQMAVAVIAYRSGSERSVVERVLAVAGLTTGLILGLFLLGRMRRPVPSWAAVTGLLAGFFAVAAVYLPTLPPVEAGLRETLPGVLGSYKKIALAWPWYAPIGAGTTVLVALAAGAFGRVVDHLQTEARNPASARLDELTPLELVGLMNREDATVAAAVATQSEAIARAVDVIADRLGRGGRLVYAGAGTSGRLGVLDAAECPPTFQADPNQVVGLIAGGRGAMFQAVEGAEDDPRLADHDLAELKLTSNDVLVGIATSGRTPYVLGAVRYARRIGAFAIGFVCNPDSELEPEVDLLIAPVVGPEVLSGSTRLKAGTATKMVLNVLSTGAMVRLGKTFGNLMVDLRVTNTKLRARANRIVRILTGLEAPAANDLLDQCKGEVKTAVVASLCGVPPDAAREKLREAGGRVGIAVGNRRACDTPVVRPSRPDLVIGIDGGGTHTVAWVADAATGTILGRGKAGPSNLRSVGVEAAGRELDEAVSRAFTAAGIPAARVGAICLGLAGVGRPDGRDAVRAWAEQAGLADRVAVVPDAALLFAAGTPDGWGLAVISGTGSIALARAPSGSVCRAGGWGYLLGDGGSGFQIALAGLRASCQAIDRCGPPTVLVERMVAATGVAAPADLVTAVYGEGWDRAAIAALTPVVLNAVGEDAVAARVVAEQVDDLARSASAAATAADLPANGIPVVLAGGVFCNSEYVRAGFLAALRKQGLEPGPVQTVGEPVAGAVALAREMVRTGADVEWTVSSSWPASG